MHVKTRTLRLLTPPTVLLVLYFWASVLGVLVLVGVVPQTWSSLGASSLLGSLYPLSALLGMSADILRRLLKEWTVWLYIFHMLVVNAALADMTSWGPFSMWAMVYGNLGPLALIFMDAKPSKQGTWPAIRVCAVPAPGPAFPSPAPAPGRRSFHSLTSSSDHLHTMSSCA